MLTAGITTGQTSMLHAISAGVAVAGSPSADGAAPLREEDRAAYRGRAPLAAKTAAGAGQGEPRDGDAAKPAAGGDAGRPAAATAADSVDFVYDIKGNVKIKFMDSMNNLVYQMPPELYYRMSSRMGTGRASVNTRV